MAIPASAIVTLESMDPYDLVDFRIDCSDLLEPYELISSYTVQPLSESVLIGLQIGPEGYPTTLNLVNLTIWVKISDAKQSDVIFQTEVLVPIEISITTNSTPPRRKQRTIVLRVVHR